ncbi:3-phosphoinositide-dependent protein kinase 1 [Hibiscus syriacus]|uniref:non-specific serine/threonine protein kinase n=1 Tax=Hibiscus syriacus TaxID=106335 RepID=A0A6A2Y6G1_HIBSY|nr:3-phosphoinositide-dependent protein kinase 1 [Hibiscus syriacus]
MDKKFITKENKTAYVKLERIVLDQLDHPGCLSEDEARFYAAEVVDALEYIHNMGLIHRDIKPENLPLTTDGYIKSADFGSVKPMRDSQIMVLPNASSDDKPCTFVGTAAYVPPEVLNSSSATFGSVNKLNVQRTLHEPCGGKFVYDLDPSKRPGANGYATLKMHPFFRGVDWSSLRAQTPPKLALEAEAQSSEGDDYNDSSWNPTHIGDGLAQKNDGIVRASSSAEPSGHITRLASIDSFDSKCATIKLDSFSILTQRILNQTFAGSLPYADLSRQQFLDPGESVLMISMVKKLQKLSCKKVQLILANKPKLIYVDPSKLVVKGNIIWSNNPNELSVQVTSPSHFKICTASI